MNMEAIIKELYMLLSRYDTKYSKEKQYRIQMLDFLRTNHNPLYEDNTDGHFTASAWIVSCDFNYVLLTHHAKLGKWFQLGGHIEKFDKSFKQACLREATEESGISDLTLEDCFVFDIDIHNIPEYKSIKGHPHYDVTLFFVAPDNAEIVITPESKQLKWIDITKVKFLTDDAAIHRMAEKMSNILIESP